MQKSKKDATELVLKTRVFFYIFSILTLVSMVFLLSYKDNKLYINNQEFNVIIASTDQDRLKGLSGRESLKQNEAMLFVFESPGIHCFWMKDMKFNIDIIWLDVNKKVIDDKQNLSPNSYPNQYCPKSDSKYVIELNHGIVSDNDISQKTQINF